MIHHDVIFYTVGEFVLDDQAAQLDLKSAKTNLSKTQAQVRKSEGSDTVLAQQKEWQSLENQNSKIADSKYSLGSAQDDYYRQLHYLDESRGSGPGRVCCDRNEP